MLVPPSRGQRVAIVAALAVPLTVIVLLSAPAWVTWPFLPSERRETVKEFLGLVIDWIKVLAGIAGGTDD